MLLNIATKSMFSSSSSSSSSSSNSIIVSNTQDLLA